MGEGKGKKKKGKNKKGEKKLKKEGGKKMRGKSPSNSLLSSYCRDFCKDWDAGASLWIKDF